VAIYTSGIICQYALEESDHVLTAVRIVDHVVVDLPADTDLGRALIINQVECYAILSFKSDGPEDFEVAYSAVAPNGQRMNPAKFRAHTEGGTHGHQMRIGMSFDPRNIGLWWIEVLVNGELALRMPLRLSRTPDQPIQTQNPPRIVLS
jgi:hypothetical protein